MIGRIDAVRKFEVVWQSINPVRADVWSKVYSGQCQAYRRLDLSLGVRRVRRTDFQKVVKVD